MFAGIRKLLFYCIVAVAMIGCCAKSNPTGGRKEIRGTGIPVAIQRKIDSIKSVPVWNPPAEVNEYEFKGQRAFLFSADCCDFFVTLYDEQGNYICAPSGGMTGKGDKKCTDFNDAAKFVKLVWKDDRSRK